MSNIINWLDNNSTHGKAKLINQLTPVVVCLVLFGFFMLSTYLFIEYAINPNAQEKVQIQLNIKDIAVGFFLYFVTAVDYALIVGRMQVSNPGFRARLVMNIFTCVGCFVGVTLVLFLWGFAKEVPWLIIPILVFAGSVMVKLAYESADYFEHATQIPFVVRKFTEIILRLLYYPTRIFTYWMPELGSPNVTKMSYWSLAKWSFFLPFIIGLDDLVGYMGAMTIYNAFGLLFGIYLADIFIDILIFVSPKITRKLVESAALSILAVYAFVYLAYKSYSEGLLLLEEHYHLTGLNIAEIIICFILLVIIVDFVLSRVITTHKFMTLNKVE